LSTDAQKIAIMKPFDEVRRNLNKTAEKIDAVIRELKDQSESGNNVAKILLYLYRGLFSIIDAEKRYQTNDYKTARTSYEEGVKMITRFLRMSGNFSAEYQQEAQRLSYFANGRQLECFALDAEGKIQEQIQQLMEATKYYTKEAALAEEIDKPLLIYNANARANFAQGLARKIEGKAAFEEKNLRLAKKLHLSAYRSFTKASYFNSSYRTWIEDQNNSIKEVLQLIVENKAQNIWGEAFELSSEGHFRASSEKCFIASRLYFRAANLTADQKKSLEFKATGHMLKASMYEAKANNYLQKKNEAKKASIEFKLAAEALEKAIETYPKRKADQSVLERWNAQKLYYTGHYHQSSGISDLDNEKYEPAMESFQIALKIFNESLEQAKSTKEKVLIKLLSKSVAEAKGYVDMCKTILS
jgi:hypothetical protein